MEKRIHIITGHYGVGKSEISVNMAINLARQGKKVLFADLDIINPYFRSVDARHELEKHGIEVITTKYANTNVDIPALTGELRKYLFDRSYDVVIDVGGDDAGAHVVGRYKSEIPGEETVLYFVINCFRPETTSLSGVLVILDEIEKSARMKVNYLINNSHLMDFTTESDIIKGIEFAHEVSTATSIPIAFHSVMSSNGIKIDKYTKEPVLLLKKNIIFPDIEKEKI